MKSVFLLLVQVLLFSGANSFAGDDSELMRRTAVPDQPPFYNIVVFEVLDTKRNLIVKKQEWTRQTYTNGFYDQFGRLHAGSWVKENGSQELSTRPVPTVAAKPIEKPGVKGTIIEPRAVDPKTADPKTSKSSKPEFHFPSRSIAREEIPSEFPDSGPTAPEKSADSAASPLRVPEILLKQVPLSVGALEWLGDNEEISESEAAELLEDLLRMREGVLEWQANMHGRFALCPVDKAEARDNGTLETLYIPYEVVKGRIWLVKVQLDNLIYGLRMGNYANEKWMATFVQLVRRVEALESQLEAIAEESKRTYHLTINDTLSAIKKYAVRFNALESEKRKTWVLRWQVIAESLQVIRERSPVFHAAFSKKKQKEWDGVIEDLDHVASKIVDEGPWTTPLSTQESLSREIYKASNRLAKLYTEAAEWVDAGLKPVPHIDAIAVLGANEDVRIFTFTQLKLLSEK